MNSIGEIFDYLNLEKNDPRINYSSKVDGLAFSKDATTEKIMVIHQSSMLDVAERSEVSFVFLDDSLRSRTNANSKKHFIFVKNPYLVFAKLTKYFDRNSDFFWSSKEQFHESSVIDPSVIFGKTSSVGPNCTVYPNVKIGEHTNILSGVVIGQNVTIGNNSTIFPNVIIYPNTKIGNNVRIHANSVLGADGFGYAKNGTKNVKIYHVGKLIIGNDVEIGASTSIDRGTLEDTIVEDGVVIDNNVQIGHNCKIGQDSVICGMVGIPGGVKIGKCVTVGGLTGFNNHVEVGDFAQIGGMTGVSKDLPAKAQVIGRPMNSPTQYHRQQVLISKLPDLFKDIKEIKSELAKK